MIHGEHLSEMAYELYSMRSKSTSSSPITRQAYIKRRSDGSVALSLAVSRWGGPRVLHNAHTSRPYDISDEV